MLKRVNKYFYLSIGISIIFLILGLLLIVFPDMSLNVFSYTVAIMFAVNGISLLMESSKKITIIDYFSLGMLSLILGILLILKPTALTTIIPITLGIWFIINGVVRVRISTLIKEFADSKWIVTFILAVLTMLCGFILIFNPKIGVVSITMFVGILLVVCSISEIIDLIMFKKHIRDLAKLLK